MRFFFIFLTFFSLSASLFAQDTKSIEKIDVSLPDPETIDIFRNDAVDFLDADLATYYRKAQEAYNAGKYEETVRYYLTALRYDIRNGNAIYNVACCYSLLRNADLAAKYLKRAVDAGYNDIEYMKIDHDFSNVRGTTVFDAAWDSIISEINKLGSVAYIEASSLYEVRVRLPENYNSNKKYPLLIGLHGHTGSAEGFMRYWRQFGQPEFIYAVPEAPYQIPGTRNSYSWRVSGTAGAFTTTSTVTTEKYIAEVVRVLSKRYNVKDVYLFGFSQGCTFTYNVGIKYPYLFKGLICFGGWLETRWLTEKAIESANRLRVFIAHGKNDRVRPYREGLAAKTLLERLGYDVTFRDFEGGHVVHEEILKEAVAWMSK